MKQTISMVSQKKTPMVQADEILHYGRQGTSCLNSMTHWGRDKMAVIFQTTFLNAFSRMKLYELQLKSY